MAFYEQQLLCVAHVTLRSVWPLDADNSQDGAVWSGRCVSLLDMPLSRSAQV